MGNQEFPACINMGCCHNQESKNHSKRFKLLVSTVKDAFTNCHSFRKRRQSSPEEDDLICYYDDEDEVFISAVISQYMELKCRRKTTITTGDKFTWAFSQTTGDLFISARLRQKEDDNEDQEKEEREDFYSIASRLSPCSNAPSFEAFGTARTIFSRSSSLDSIDFQDLGRHSVIQELSDCEGWPFGLYRKALLLPPLPKSPSDSWSWRKSGRMVKMQ